MTTATLPFILPSVINLVKQAGAWLGDKFSRPDGPRFSYFVSAPIDTEIELFLRDGLTKYHLGPQQPKAPEAMPEIAKTNP